MEEGDGRSGFNIKKFRRDLIGVNSKCYQAYAYIGLEKETTVFTMR